MIVLILTVIIITYKIEEAQYLSKWKKDKTEFLNNKTL